MRGPLRPWRVHCRCVEQTNLRCDEIGVGKGLGQGNTTMACAQRRGVRLLLRYHRDNIGAIAFFSIHEQYLTPVLA